MSGQVRLKKQRKNTNDLRSKDNVRNDFVAPFRLPPKGEATSAQPDYLFVRCNAKYVRVNFSELICIRGRRGYIQVVTETESLIIMNNLNEIIELLPEHLFCRVHHSFIVAVNRIKAFDNEKVYLYEQPEGKEFRGGLSKAKELPIGAHYRRNLKKSISFLPSKIGRRSKIVKEAEAIITFGLEDEGGL